MKKKTGVSLITLIITIIVMIILAGTVIIAMSNNSTIERADEATFKSNVSSYKEELSMYIANRILEDNMYDSSTLIADKDSGSEVVNGTKNELAGIQAVIKSMKALETEIFTIQNGKLMISEDATDKQKKWANALGVNIEMREFGKNGNTESGSTSVNRPVLTEGLTPIIFNENGETVAIGEGMSNWYAYIDQGAYKTDGKTSRWANAESKDGSQWVWIPRYAYKINYTNSANKSVASEIDVVFIDINNKDEAGNDYTNGYNGYIVHPAFTSDVNKGGWDSELSGIWIAKYEAGFAGINGIPSSKESSVTYSFNISNELGNVRANVTKMTYPVFKPNAYSYNKLCAGDSYALCRALIEEGNSYGFTQNANSHMLKNSEWGAVAYLAQSKYGRNGIEVTINSKGAVTGYSNEAENTYNTENGMKASTTGNLYGIYDMSGGLWERTAGYINNGNASLLTYGRKMVDENNDNVVDGSTNKFISVYNMGTSDSNANNYSANSSRVGEAIWETSRLYSGSGSWFNDYSSFPYAGSPFFCRGGGYGSMGGAGLFSLGCINSVYDGVIFRAALCISAQ